MNVEGILRAAWTMAGWPYGAPAHWPRRPGDPRVIDCCTFSEAVLLNAWALPPMVWPWSLTEHLRAMAGSAEHFDPWGPVEVYASAGLATLRGTEQPPVEPMLLQGWRRALPNGEPDIDGGGHTVLILGYVPDTGRCLVLEANTASSGLDGPGFRGLGPLRVGAEPARPQGWELDRRCPTWDVLKLRYPLRRCATLVLEQQEVGP